MTLVKSTETSPGTPAPDFDLPAVDGERYSLDSFEGDDALVVMFICNHCPYVKGVRQRLIDLAEEYEDRVGFIAINSNDAERYPDDSFVRMKEIAEEFDYPFPYAFDESQDVARAYDARCTPDFFLFDEERRLAYRGRLDDNWKEPEKVEKRDLRDAIEAVLAGEEPASDQKPSMGCSIKWKR